MRNVPVGFALVALMAATSSTAHASAHWRIQLSNGDEGILHVTQLSTYNRTDARRSTAQLRDGLLYVNAGSGWFTPALSHTQVKRISVDRCGWRDCDFTLTTPEGHTLKRTGTLHQVLALQQGERTLQITHVQGEAIFANGAQRRQAYELANDPYSRNLWIRTIEFITPEQAQQQKLAYARTRAHLASLPVLVAPNITVTASRTVKTKPMGHAPSDPVSQQAAHSQTQQTLQGLLERGRRLGKTKPDDAMIVALGIES